MSYFRSGDPLDDFNRLDREQAEYEAKLPKCDICDHPIQDEHYYEISGDKICPDCLSYFRRENEALNH